MANNSLGDDQLKGALSLLPKRPFHALIIDEVKADLKTSPKGLLHEEANRRLFHFGQNVFPSQRKISVFKIFIRQFLSPLIYALFAASLISILFGDFTDALFIGIVLFVNALIGTAQEYGAEKGAQALRQMVASKATVERAGEVVEIDAENLVPGDIVLLESGQKVPADLRLISSRSLEVDESLLTGESIPIEKDHQALVTMESSIGDRVNMAFTGTLVTKGRAKGIVVSTGLNTELGQIAGSLIFEESAKPPLLVRMEIFTKKIALILLLMTSGIAIFLFQRGHSLQEVLMVSVAIAVSAIPEGLPVALTVALSIASRRMARRHVIVRKLPAVEALGSCTYIATDKTGTLTVNQLTIQRVALPGFQPISVTGSGLDPIGKVEFIKQADADLANEPLRKLVAAGALCNEARLSRKNQIWSGLGDAVDLAFLVFSHKNGIDPELIRSEFKLVEEVPFEPHHQFAATKHEDVSGKYLISVKGAFEKVLLMCKTMQTPNGPAPIDTIAISRQADEMAELGFRVLALASDLRKDEIDGLKSQLSDLNFLGLVGMIDPLRPEAADAIASCKSAGINVAMVTGDHPKTSLAIARTLGLANHMEDVVTGHQLRSAFSFEEKSALINSAHVFARVEPQQKLEIVQHLLQSGHFVAVTGDGANDAPALKAANVGVAMGKSGTDVAKETSDLIITDDRFASIVAGIEQGRVAYSNIRKVVYLLTSTGAAEILMFALSIFFGTPLPLTAVQLLWLNLVTNGIQDAGLAFEPGEGDELKAPPRKPSEPIFNRMMVERVILSALVMGVVSFWLFNSLIDSGLSIEAARNSTLLLMVLFENMMVGNCRSETKSAFALSPLRNKVLLIGTVSAQLVHILAMYTPGLREVLGVGPVSLNEWLKLLLMALSVLVVMEIHKLFRPRN